jgi:hypothetical protein
MPHYSRPPEPWHSFFAEIAGAFDHPVVLHCIGGFAIAMLYGLFGRACGPRNFMKKGAS